MAEQTKLTRVTDEQIAKLDDSTNGARFWGYSPEVK